MMKRVDDRSCERRKVLYSIKVSHACSYFHVCSENLQFQISCAEALPKAPMELWQWLGSWAGKISLARGCEEEDCKFTGWLRHYMASSMGADLNL